MFPTEGTGCFWVERCFENTGVCLCGGGGARAGQQLGIHPVSAVGGLQGLNF